MDTGHCGAHSAWALRSDIAGPPPPPRALGSAYPGRAHRPAPSARGAVRDPHVRTVHKHNSADPHRAAHKYESACPCSPSPGSPWAWVNSMRGRYRRHPVGLPCPPLVLRVRQPSRGPIRPARTIAKGVPCFRRPCSSTRSASPPGWLSVPLALGARPRLTTGDSAGSRSPAHQPPLWRAHASSTGRAHASTSSSCPYCSPGRPPCECECTCSVSSGNSAPS